VIEMIVADPVRFGIRDEVHELLRPAWESARGAFEPVLGYLSGDVDAALGEVGLTGSELALKLAAIDLGFDDLNLAMRRGRLRRIVKAIKKLFAFVDVALDSLAKVLNQADRIAEIKDAIDALLPDDDNGQDRDDDTDDDGEGEEAGG
jgi:hypothetical protein